MVASGLVQYHKCPNVTWLKLFFKMYNMKIFETIGSVCVPLMPVRYFLSGYVKIHLSGGFLGAGPILVIYITLHNYESCILSTKLF